MRLKPSATRFSLLLGALFSVAPAWSADLLQVYRDALVNDAQYAAARATAEAGREKLPQGLSGLLPTIGASANTVWNNNTYHPDGGAKFDHSYNSNGYMLTLSQPLFRWQNWVQYDQAKLQVMQSEANFAQASQDLVLRVAQAYFDVLYAQEALKAVRANKEAITQQFEQAKKNFEVGTATITDSQEAQSRYDLASAQEIAAINELDVRRYALRLVVGKDPGELNVLKPDVQLAPPQPATMENWVLAAETSSFAVQVQQAAAELAAKETERARAGHYPTLDAVANYGRANNTNGNDIDTDVRNIGLQLNIPLYQGGYVNSKTREAVANRSAAQSGLEAARRSATLNAQQSFLGVVNGLAQIKALEKEIAALKGKLASMRNAEAVAPASKGPSLA